MNEAKVPPVNGLPCVDCGRPAFAYDHRHYSKPLELEPVCRTCNIRRGPALDVAEVIKDGIPFIPSDHLALGISDVDASGMDLVAEMDSFERGAIEKALSLNKWNVTRSAEWLGISFRALRYRIKRLNIEL